MNNQHVVSWMILSAFCLTSCGSAGNIKQAIKERLRDPQSAVFDDIVYSKAGDWACVEYNAKNAFGGYGEPSRAELKREKGTWEVVRMKSICNAERLEEASISDAAQQKAETEFLMLLVDSPKPIGLDKCFMTQSSYAIAVGELAVIDFRAKGNSFSDYDKESRIENQKKVQNIKAGIVRGECIEEIDLSDNPA